MKIRIKKIQKCKFKNLHSSFICYLFLFFKEGGPINHFHREGYKRGVRMCVSKGLIKNVIPCYVYYILNGRTGNNICRNF